MRDVFLPSWLIKVAFFNPWIFKMGFFLGFLSLAVIAYKFQRITKQIPVMRFLMGTFYAGMFWTGTNSFLYHPYYTNLFSMLLAIPMLVSHVALAVFLIRRYGIGGGDTQGE